MPSKAGGVNDWLLYQGYNAWLQSGHHQLWGIGKFIVITNPTNWTGTRGPLS